MDVLKQDFTTELKNMKTENIEWSSDSEMTENSYMSQTSRLFLEEQTQNRNGNQEMTLNQDILGRNTPNKDVHTGNLQDEEQNDSIENKTCQLNSIVE
nr:zinc finger protein OZF-like [Biomphalaria glabrata]